MSEHVPWCTDHADSGCRSAARTASTVSIRLVQSLPRQHRPQLMVLHAGAGYPYPCLLLPFSEATEFIALIRALGHKAIANAAERVLRDSGATLTEEYGRQHWEMPETEQPAALSAGTDSPAPQDPRT